MLSILETVLPIFGTPGWVLQVVTFLTDRPQAQTLRKSNASVRFYGVAHTPRSPR